MSVFCFYVIIDTSILGVKVVNKRKGQALVEFVIILPIFLLLILGVIDLGKIIYMQNTMENALDDAITLYRADKTYDEIITELHRNDEKLSMEITNENNNYVNVKLTKSVEIITPGLNLIIKNPHTILVSRVIKYE